MLDGLDTDRRGDVRLARAGTSDQDPMGDAGSTCRTRDGVGVVEEVAAMKLLHEGLVDLAAGEVEAIQITVGREAR
ncbi:hypothetical protein ASG58_03835 [Rhizobium sp. Leaf383]|nr:hypothetical protein ASG58_03835 [Rhizobium sp. Leaf383]